MRVQQAKKDKVRKDVVVHTNQAAVSTESAVRFWTCQSLCTSFFIRSTDQRKPGVAALHASMPHSDEEADKGLAERALNRSQLDALSRGELASVDRVSLEGSLRGLSGVLEHLGVPRESQELVIVPSGMGYPNQISLFTREYVHQAKHLGLFSKVSVGEPGLNITADVRESTVKPVDVNEVPEDVLDELLHPPNQ